MAEGLQVDQLISWLSRFSGTVPKHWESCDPISEDLREAGKREVQLSPTLINACLQFPDWRVVMAVAQHQDLNLDQLESFTSYNFLSVATQAEAVLAADKQRRRLASIE